MTVSVGTTLSTPAGRGIACADHGDLFQHPLVEDEPGRPRSAAQRKARTSLVREAAQVCAGCPVVEACLYRAVVRHDVAGFVAGTTEAQRQRIRVLLDITVRPEDLDSLAGGSAAGGQVNHAEIVRLRHQNPHMSLDTIAQRLGCSLSTVKRHLRRARAESFQPAPDAGTRPPSHHEVRRARDAVVRNDREKDREPRLATAA